MIYQFESAKAFLQSHFDERVRRNARYSLRAYAKFLGVNPAELSQVFKGQRNLSFASAQKVVKALGFNNDESKYFLWTLQADKGKAFGLDLDFTPDKDKANIPEQHFAEICQWFHFAILSLIDTKNFEWNSSFVAKSLGLTLTEAGLAMRDLQKFGLVKVEKKTPKATKTTVRISSTIPSAAIRTYHRQMLQKSIEALDSVPLELREYQSVGIALDEAELKNLKKEIDEFTDRVLAKYHKKNAKNVYQIQIAAFPLSKGVLK